MNKFVDALMYAIMVMATVGFIAVAVVLIRYSHNRGDCVRREAWSMTGFAGTYCAEWEAK